MDSKTGVFSFRFYFGGDRTMDFCAENMTQAMCLYDDCCRNDLDINDVPYPDNIEVIYDADAAEKYGRIYKRPEQYKGERFSKR